MCSAAESGEASMPIAPGSTLRLPQPISRTILHTVAQSPTIS
jgi:hypothetical protein